MSQDFLEYVAVHIKSAVVFRVLQVILARTKMQNVVRFPQKDIAALLGLSAPQVSRAFRELTEHGILVKMKEPDGRMEWYLSPQVGVRGSGSSQAWLNRRVAKEVGMLVPFDEKRRAKALELANP